MLGLEDLASADDSEPMYNRIMHIVGIILPAHVFTDAVTKMTDVSRFNSFCKHNFAMCKVNMMPTYLIGYDKEKCCCKLFYLYL